MKNTNRQAFTLVELIVVIVILSILSTIAFLSFSSQAGSARDSARLADLSSINKGLTLFQVISGTLPIPDSSITITASGTPIGYQGKAGSKVLGMIKLSNGGKDPLDSSYYNYSVNSNQSKYELLGFLEDGTNSALSFDIFKIEKGFTDNSKGFPIPSGDQLGIFLSSGTLDPIVGSSTGIYEIINANTGLVNLVIAKNTTLALSGNLIFSTFYNLRNDLINNKALAKYDDSLISYWDMETICSGGACGGAGNDGKLLDWSKYLNYGTCFNGVASSACGVLGPQVVSANGTTGKGMNFDGIDDYVEINNDTLYDLDNMTLYAKVKHSGTGEANVGGGWRIISRQDLSAELISNNLFYLRISDSKAADNVTAKTRGNFDYGVRPNGIVMTGSNTNSVVSPTAIDNNYHTLFGVRSPTSFYRYMDGTKKSEGVNVGGKLVSNASKVYISGMNVGADELFAGVIDEVRIYNRALTEAEVVSLNNANK